MRCGPRGSLAPRASRGARRRGRTCAARRTRSTAPKRRHISRLDVRGHSGVTCPGMAAIIHPALVDARAVAKAIQDWLDCRRFETKALQAGASYFVKARKASVLRAVVGADRALEIEVGQADGKTIVDVRQGSWTTNVVSNLGWLLVTGGMNLAFSGWSVIIQKELESHIRSVLAELGGVHEVDLKTGTPVPPKLAGSLRPDPLTKSISRFGGRFVGVCPPAETIDPTERRPADISFHCHNCGQRIVIDSAGARLQVSCPTCQTDLSVPGASG
jgi:hypothetical protein